MLWGREIVSFPPGSGGVWCRIYLRRNWIEKLFTTDSSLMVLTALASSGRTHDSDHHWLRNTSMLQTLMAQNGGSGLSQSSPTFPLLRASYRSRLAGRIQVVSISILKLSRLYRYTHAPPPTPTLVGECVSGREDAGVPGCIRNNSQPSF